MEYHVLEILFTPQKLRFPQNIHLPQHLEPESPHPPQCRSSNRLPAAQPTHLPTQSPPIPHSNRSPQPPPLQAPKSNAHGVLSDILPQKPSTNPPLNIKIKPPSPVQPQTYQTLLPHCSASHHLLPLQPTLYPNEKIHYQPPTPIPKSKIHSPVLPAPPQTTAEKSPISPGNSDQEANPAIRDDMNPIL